MKFRLWVAATPIPQQSFITSFTSVVISNQISLFQTVSLCKKSYEFIGLTGLNGSSLATVAPDAPSVLPRRQQRFRPAQEPGLAGRNWPTEPASEPDRAKPQPTAIASAVRTMPIVWPGCRCGAPLRHAGRHMGGAGRNRTAAISTRYLARRRVA